MACASSLASSLAAVRSLARARRPRARRGSSASPRADTRARARLASPRLDSAPSAPTTSRRAAASSTRASRARLPRAAATDAPGGDASDAETERPARRVRRLPRRGGKPGTGDRAEARATAAATDPPRDDETDETDDESDAPQVFDMRELYGDDYDFDDEDEDDEEAMDEDALDAALASMSSPPSSASDASDVRVLPPLSAQLLSGDPPGHKSGYVAIIGRPNAGKSTLLNQLVGTKLSIVTYKPQTTRHRILGIVSEPSHQMVFLDTPGVMREEFNKLDEIMLRSVRGAMANADVTLVIVDASRDAHGDFEGLLPPLKNPGEGDRAPIAVILNKCDLLELEDIRVLKREFETAYADRVEAVFPVSALAGVGHDKAKEWCVERMPPGPTLYPKDAISEHPERFFVAEIIREKIFLQYAQEIPYSTQVWVQSHKERDGVKKDLIIAKIFVERKSQVGILIGAGGKALKRLGAAAREDIEAFLGRPVFLDLGVKVRDGWRSDESALEDLGLDDPNRLEQPSLGPKPDRVA